jgi:hypothetical protein
MELEGGGLGEDEDEMIGIPGSYLGDHATTNTVVLAMMTLVRMRATTRAL